MTLQDSLGDRMKKYESRNQYFLQRRIPVCIRVDMRAGHTFTRGFARPFDEVFINAMIRTMEYCAKNIGNCVFAYCQSDEITFILVDYAKLETDAWFDYRTDKLCSITASMATMAFNKYFSDLVGEYTHEYFKSWNHNELDEKYLNSLTLSMNNGAMFDSRCFNIPKEEVANLIYWRQLDATRNSIQMVGQYYFSHKELQGKSCNQIQEMLLTRKDFNWNNMMTHLKRGCCCIKNRTICEFGEIKLINNEIEENRWFVDLDIPIFKGDGRKYIEDLVYIGE